MINSVTIKPVNIDDAEKILEIYGYYVLNSAVSFEYKVPSKEEFRERIRKISKDYPYYAAFSGDKILGFAYAAPFAEREAYKFSAELSIYIDKEYKRHGIGRLLYEKLEKDLKSSGITNLYAEAAIPDGEDEYLDFTSLKFHQKMGFIKTGEFHKCGYKFNRWYSTVCMEKIINPHR